ncbi:uncharacterized protein MELLADRAFT_69898 [Melampsora larici-populina 98AG31]|uniref:Uncharacterized protein n=1 Tax=Melampsora larici-populina (strain 98AG31 / pathotype 3-4-7) TaxID=747676 RepID=F4SCP4_MELLP|nr:uncharacterized protein MELLADRAFT_69898 [Melampsora larici-populina 98AG31]EGF97580.1 hypothetical protein MELLADRAFT_69898 [Melampsora larici-populina 98AG31]
MSTDTGQVLNQQLCTKDMVNCTCTHYKLGVVDNIFSAFHSVSGDAHCVFSLRTKDMVNYTLTHYKLCLVDHIFSAFNIVSVDVHQVPTTHYKLGAVDQQIDIQQLNNNLRKLNLAHNKQLIEESFATNKWDLHFSIKFYTHCCTQPDKQLAMFKVLLTQRFIPTSQQVTTL